MRRGGYNSPTGHSLRRRVVDPPARLVEWLRKMSRPFDATRMVFERAGVQPLKAAKEALLGQWGKHLSGRMLSCEWNSEEGWSSPVIRDSRPLALSPAASCLHYALQCFEGMKAYKGDDGKIRLFRPELNAKRFNTSLKRLAMPELPEDEFVEALKLFVRDQEDWIPEGEGYAGYLRPTAIATDAALGVGPPQNVTFFALLSPVGPYFHAGFKPVSVYADSVNVRAWPSGHGAYKIGANYAPSIRPQKAAAKLGASQVLYCTAEGQRQRLTEVGSMNIFVLWTDAQTGRLTLSTPLLHRGDILPGVTRRSVLELAMKTDHKDRLVVDDQTDIYIDQLQLAAKEGRLLELFGAGTAALICPIKSILLQNDEQIQAPNADHVGPLVTRLLTDLGDIHYGRSPLSKDWCQEVP